MCLQLPCSLLFVWANVAGATSCLPDAAGGGFLNSMDHQGRSPQPGGTRKSRRMREARTETADGLAALSSSVAREVPPLARPDSVWLISSPMLGLSCISLANAAWPTS